MCPDLLAWVVSGTGGYWETGESDGAAQEMVPVPGGQKSHWAEKRGISRRLPK